MKPSGSQNLNNLSESAGLCESEQKDIRTMSEKLTCVRISGVGWGWGGGGGEILLFLKVLRTY